MASLLTDNRPSRLPILAAWIQLDDGEGDGATGGVNDTAYADPDAFFTNSDGGSPSMDSLITAGIRDFTLAWWCGRFAANDEYVTGSGPFAYPDANIAGFASKCSPQTEVQHEAAVASGAYPDAFVTALDTAGRKGSIYTLHLYQGATPANVAVDDTTAETYTATVRALGARLAIDAQAVADYANDMATPDLMNNGTLELADMLKAWWDADVTVYEDAGTDAAENDDPVQQMNDRDTVQSPANCTQATIGNRPTYKTNIVNSKPVLRFDGTDDFMTCAPGNTSSTGAIIAVVSLDTTSEMHLFGGAGTTGVVFNNTSAGCISLRNATQHVRSAAGALGTGTFAVVGIRWNGTRAQIRVNGTEVSYATAQTFGTASNITRLGSTATPSLFFDGDYAGGCIIASAEPTDNEMALIERWYGKKFNINIAASATLPHKKVIQRYNTLTGLKVIGEGWPVDDLDDTDGWLDYQSGAVANQTQARGSVNETAGYSVLHNPASLKAISIEPQVLVESTFGTVAERLTEALYWTRLSLQIATRIRVHIDWSSATVAEVGSAERRFRATSRFRRWRWRRRARG